MSFKIPPGFLPDKWYPSRPFDDAIWPACSYISTWNWADIVLASCAPYSSWSWNCRGGPCRRGQGCPVLVTADSGWLYPWTHHALKWSPSEHVQCLCENILRKGQKMPKGRRQTWEGTPQRQGGNKATRTETRDWANKEVRGHGGAPWLSRHTPKGTVAHRGITLEQRKWVWENQQRKKRVRNKERQRETITPWPQPTVPLITPPKGLSVTCGDNKREEVCLECSWAWERGRKNVLMFVFFASQYPNQQLNILKQ